MKVLSTNIHINELTSMYAELLTHYDGHTRNNNRYHVKFVFLHCNERRASVKVAISGQEVFVGKIEVLPEELHNSEVFAKNFIQWWMENARRYPIISSEIFDSIAITEHNFIGE